MKVAYFNCFSGAAGDMIVAALLDAGADLEQFSDAIDRLGLSGYRISVEKIKKQGIAATYFSVALNEARQPHRHLKHIVEIIEKGKMSPSVSKTAIEIFTRLAQVEAKVHNTTIEKVHFHEVGAVDAIIDIVGAAVALELLGIEKVVCSPIPVGNGTIACDHGVMPVPAPATAELLKGVPIAECNEIGELITPTGAAILTSLASGFGTMPGMTATTIGYGAGTRDGKTRPNLLRVTVGDTTGTEFGEVEHVTILETNLDDATPQVVAYCSERLFGEGALDVWTQPIQMKKQRSGVLLSVLCRTAEAGAMERILFQETPTLGIRRRDVERKSLVRRFENVNTRFGQIHMKIGQFENHATTAPEYEECRTAAIKHGVPLREVIAEANSAWRARTSEQ